MKSYKNIPISFKIGLSFLIFALILLSILFVVLIPKIEKEQYHDALIETEKKLLLSKYQIKLVVDYFKNYTQLKKNESELKINNILDNIKLKSQLNKNYSNSEFYNDINNITKQYNCQIVLSKNSNNITLNNINQSFDFDNIPYNKWQEKKNSSNVCPKPGYSIYKTSINKQDIKITCNSYFNRVKHKNKLEMEIKELVQSGFSLSENIHKGKIYIIWINNKIKNGDLNKSIDTINNENNQNYCVSKISNYRFPKTGNLTVKKILEVDDTKRIEHEIDNKKTLTWVSKIYKEDDKSFIFIQSAFEKDFKNDINNPILTILYISIFALILSILFGYFLFRRWLNNIEKLSVTARQICSGKLNFRSNIKGNDDIGILGVAFDSMLDKLEENIKTLDTKVEKRTIELTTSLKTKELLLKEIHHRVKNNLSLTISFIKLQKIKIKDQSILDALSSLETRVYTMALLHTKLYESQNLDSIDFNIYISQLIEDIKSTYEENINVSITIDIENIYLNIDQAMPCGLIVNEVVVNAFKYAFTDNQNNSYLKISFIQNELNNILEIKDNGKGIDENINTEKLDTLGLNLINSIAITQLKGKISIKNNFGTQVNIIFPK